MAPQLRHAASPPPLSECLKDNVARFMPAWTEDIAPAIKANHKVLIAALAESATLYSCF